MSAPLLLSQLLAKTSPVFVRSTLRENLGASLAEKDLKSVPLDDLLRWWHSRNRVAVLSHPHRLWLAMYRRRTTDWSVSLTQHPIEFFSRWIPKMLSALFVLSLESFSYSSQGTRMYVRLAANNSGRRIRHKIRAFFGRWVLQQKTRKNCWKTSGIKRAGYSGCQMSQQIICNFEETLTTTTTSSQCQSPKPHRENTLFSHHRSIKCNPTIPIRQAPFLSANMDTPIAPLSLDTKTTQQHGWS